MQAVPKLSTPKLALIGAALAALGGIAWYIWGSGEEITYRTADVQRGRLEVTVLAAGAIEAAFCTLAIRDGVVPPTINLDNPQEGCDLDYVAHKARTHKVSVAMSNSFGFGGTNASIVIGAYK
jgi:hypothetical protein